ncbi:MAG: antibiotic biosynthesis monooxygenase [Bacteroidaceae bacterium]|nr:antibiotic biosynthesis monooxygenase [Bacteroidaceae bacterium]
MKKVLLMVAVAFTALLVACSGNKKTNEEAVSVETASVETTIRLNCKLTVDVTNRDKAIELCKQLVAASLSDEGVIDYDVLASVSHDDRLMIFETWKDQASLDKHSASVHFTSLVPQIQQLGKMEIKQMEVKKEVDTEKPFRFNIMQTTDKRDAYVEAMRPLIEGTRKNEPSNIDYDLYCSLTRSNKVMLLEIWPNQQALDAHLASAHFTEIQPKTKGLTDGQADFARMAE